MAGLGAAPWAQDLLWEWMDSIRATLGDAYLPIHAPLVRKQLDESWGDIAIKARQRDAQNLTEYGCGAFGCALPTTGGLTLKVTSDVQEAWFAALAVGRSGHFTAGVSAVHAVFAVPGARHLARPVFFVWREAALSPGTLHHALASVPAHTPSGRSLHAHASMLDRARIFGLQLAGYFLYCTETSNVAEWFRLLAELRAPLDDEHAAWVTDLVDGRPPRDVHEFHRELSENDRTPAFFGTMLGAYRGLLMRVARESPELRAVAQSVLRWQATGVVLPDLHAGNLMRIERDGAPVWGLVDQGVALPMDENLYRVEIPTLR